MPTLTNALQIAARVIQTRLKSYNHANRRKGRHAEETGMIASATFRACLSSAHMFCKERENVVRDWVYILFQGKVTAVNEVDLRVGHVFLEGLGACRKKDRIIFAPNR
jgi:hypothetical protein